MAIHTLPAQGYLVQCLDYDPQSGFLLWRRRPVEHFAKPHNQVTWNKCFAERRAGNLTDKGYRVLGLNGVTYRAHRLIWRMVTGDSPDEVDHENGNRDENTWTNLRAVTHYENGKNRRRNAAKSSPKGISWHKRSRKWMAHIRSDGQRFYLGQFDDPQSAKAAYDAAAIRLHGEFFNPG